MPRSKHNKTKKLKPKPKPKPNQKQKKETSFKWLQCRPGRKPLRTSRKGHSCYSTSELLQLRNLWNIRHQDDQIETTCPVKVWENLRSRLATVCDKESCWLNKVAGNRVQSLLRSFRPTRPASWDKNPNTWLSSVDLSNVMTQYEADYPHYEFMGPSPIDFATLEYESKCVWPELCNFNLSQLVSSPNPKQQVGIIFNLDPHTKGGSHWVSMFVDVPKEEIFFFDSVGDPAPPEVEQLAATIIEQGKHLQPHSVSFSFDQNYPFEHQESNTECGIYALYFLSTILEGKRTAQDFKTKLVTDEEMEKHRSIFFNREL